MRQFVVLAVFWSLALCSCRAGAQETQAQDSVSGRAARAIGALLAGAPGQGRVSTTKSDEHRRVPADDEHGPQATRSAMAGAARNSGHAGQR